MEGFRRHDPFAPKLAELPGKFLARREAGKKGG
jgi:hypothetical protein